MSDARVNFDTLDDLDADPGNEQTFSFSCPRKINHRCGSLIIRGRTDLPHDPQGQNGGIAQWGWDGNRDTPTFTPSINCSFCGWHGFLERGRCLTTSKQEEPEPTP